MTLNSTITPTLGLLALIAICAVAHGAEIDDQIKCATEGRKFAKEWGREHDARTAVFSDALVDNAEFHFSRKLNTCLVYTAMTEGERATGSTGIWHYKRITDIYSNRVLVYTRYMTDKKTKKDYYVPLMNVGEAKLLTDSDFNEIKAMYFSD